MRVKCLIFAAIIAVVCPGPCGAAQSGPTEKAAQSPDANKATARVGSLSPGEARRAERARARAAAMAQKATPPQPSKTAHADKPPAAPPKDTAAGQPAQAAARVTPAATPQTPTTRTADADRRPRHTKRRRAIAKDDRRPRWQTRRTYAGDAMRAPRAGDVVPYGVPLYALPPGRRFAPDPVYPPYPEPASNEVGDDGPDQP